MPNGNKNLQIFSKSYLYAFEKFINYNLWEKNIENTSF